MGPDKVFGVTRAWADENPVALQAVVRALLRAAAWADAPENRGDLAAMLAADGYINAPEAAIRNSLADNDEIARRGLQQAASYIPD